MGIYNNLPVYKTTYDMLTDIFKACQNMERDYKYTIAEKIKNETTELILNVYRANSYADKKPHIAKAREQVEVLRLLLRLLNIVLEVSSLNSAKHHIVETDNISFQIN
ncbi:MAG: four helix bundle protein [Bacteroidales bacterium]|jgi:hypothetical protein|nr:four helix bundle protein [Bacteroidales bacterium]